MRDEPDSVLKICHLMVPLANSLDATSHDMVESEEGEAAQQQHD